MRLNLIVLGLALQACSTPALAAEASVIGASAEAAMPASVAWSVTDRAIINKAKTRSLANDSGTDGWGLEYVSLRSLHLDGLPLVATRLKIHARHLKFAAWHYVGTDTALGLSAFAGTTSRLDRSSSIFPKKTKAQYAGVELALVQGENWRLRGDVFYQGGWGGRSLEADAIRMTNGEPAKARGLRATLEVPVAESGAMLSLVADVGPKALAPGEPVHHRRQLGLGLTASF
ncbi:hypothetical protein GCM10011349_38570 [Novosphingobium indicum]|uniref:DUF481 domain-containing protein n=1 Tax=Novosphingobium indicum TaxID=462949 RepID=A0ABQ2JYQ1_9SPHN|nr:hypothetical protein GCM10011349_38570 [Novosphingobium indicum]